MAIIKANYGYQETMYNAFSLLYTKIFWKNARLIRLPFRMRGKKAFKYEEGLTTGYSCRIEIGGDLNHDKLRIGKNCVIGDYTHIVANESVTIGNNVLMASRVFITDTTHGSYCGDDDDSPPDSAPNMRRLSFQGVTIGDNVWIGENVSILPGAYIGSGCIIGANSVVIGNVSDHSIAVGSPAVVKKRYDPQTKRWIKLK